MAKKVLIVSRREFRKNKPINWVSEIYLHILGEANIIPVIIPISEKSVNQIEHYLQDYDGLLMVEGGDIQPSLYGKTYAPENLQEVDAIKDHIEFTCCKHALAHNKPILGICRGLHILNVICNGTLHEDIHQFNNNTVLHVNYEDYDTHRHVIRIEKNTPLHTWYNCSEIYVTTYHHQGIQKLGDNLIPMAFSEDNLIEAAYHPNYTFVVGLQFHPERMLNEHIGNYSIFKSFIKTL